MTVLRSSTHMRQKIYAKSGQPSGGTTGQSSIAVSVLKMLNGGFKPWQRSA